MAVIKSAPLTLAAGVHTTRFQPQSGEAPILDKIDLVDPSNPEDAPIAHTREKGVEALRSLNLPCTSGKVYPNPGRPGATIYLPSTSGLGVKAAKITLYDARGVALKNSVQATSAGFRLPNIPAGIYLLRVDESGSTKTYRIMVQ